MNFSPEMGKIYDTMFFFIEYYNKDFIEKNFKGKFSDISTMEAYFQEVKDKVEIAPVYLAPFFYLTSYHPSILSNLFIKHFSEINGELTNLLEIIRNEREVLHTDVLSLFLDNNNTCNELIQSLSISADQIAFLFGRFDQVIDEMCNFLETVYQAVDNLHTSHKNNIEAVFEQNSADTNKLLLNEYMELSQDDINNATVTYSILNQYLLFGATCNGSVTLLLGTKYDEKAAIEFDNSLSSADNFLTVCSGELRVKMLHALIDHKELTATQMAKLIDCPPTTLIRPISILQDNKIIYISRRSGLQIFYRLNIPLFKKIYRSLSAMFEKIIDTED